MRRRAYISENQNVQERSKYNCEGMFSDITGPSEATSEIESILVKYAYDLFIEKGSNLNNALGGLQSRLLQHVGENIFTDCDSDESVIQEITMGSNDAPHPTDSCKIEAEFDVETDCYPMTGRAKVYYTASEQADQIDEGLIIETMSKAVKSAMDNSVLVTDTVIAAYFIGERDSFKFRSSDYYRNKGSPGHPDSSTWIERNKGWVAGLVAALVVVLTVGVCLKCRKKKASADC
ncbi:hypothetical protein ACHAWT_007473 [Skeletonema menzelii]